jgi:hypothetical protein
MLLAPEGHLVYLLDVVPADARREDVEAGLSRLDYRLFTPAQTALPPGADHFVHEDFQLQAAPEVITRHALGGRSDDGQAQARQLLVHHRISLSNSGGCHTWLPRLSLAQRPHVPIPPPRQHPK